MSNSTAEHTMSSVLDHPAWTDDELRTLIHFRHRVGRRWKSTLLDLYMFGKDDDEPEGSGLRRIRNRQGPSRVHGLKASLLDAAETRLSADSGQPS